MRAAERLGQLYREIVRAISCGDVAFSSVVPMLLRLTSGQCDLLWVTESIRE